MGDFLCITTLEENSEAQPTASAEMVPDLIWTPYFLGPEIYGPKKFGPAMPGTISALAQPTGYMCQISAATIN